MIVVVGSPVFLRAKQGRGAPGGLAAQVALAVAAAGGKVQAVGKVGDDEAGDAVLSGLAAAGVGHAAVLRDAAHATPVVDPVPAADLEDDVDELPLADDEGPTDAGAVAVMPAGLPLEAADVQLALRYLTDFRVVVIAMPLDGPTLGAAFEAAAFASAHVIRLDGSTDSPESADVASTAFEPPAHDEPAFADLVGRYAAALDAGRAPADAFRDSTRGTNWERATPTDA